MEFRAILEINWGYLDNAFTIFRDEIKGILELLPVL